jgi:hypothetical protein
MSLGALILCGSLTYADGEPDQQPAGPATGEQTIQSSPMSAAGHATTLIGVSSQAEPAVPAQKPTPPAKAAEPASVQALCCDEYDDGVDLGVGSWISCALAKDISKDPAAKSHKGVFYENNFDYLCDPSYTQWHLGDCLKRIPVGSSIMVDFGGQFRMRHHSERNHRGLGLTGRDDDFLLYRTRLYTNVEVGSVFRFYAEMIDAVSYYEEFPPRPIEENRSDILNLFADLLLYDNAGQLWLRVGRQELIYGAQRTVSPLDWANTRRTFEGYKVMWKSEAWDIDAFWVRPVRVQTKSLDQAIYAQEFMGVYATYKCRKGQPWELYYLRFEDEDVDLAFDTFGTRIYRDYDPWLAEFEGAVQLGDYQHFEHNASSWTIGFGRKLKQMPWSPVIWFYYDWASGSDERNNGYHHLFPLAHKYMGFMDLFGRRNIETPNVLLTLKPAARIKLLLWYYYLFLEDKDDVPYSVVMTPYNTANDPVSAELGHEIDLIVQYQITARSNILFGYSHFFAGDYYKDTPGVLYNDDASFFYTQFLVNF